LGESLFYEIGINAFLYMKFFTIVLARTLVNNITHKNTTLYTFSIQNTVYICQHNLLKNYRKHCSKMNDTFTDSGKYNTVYQFAKTVDVDYRYHKKYDIIHCSGLFVMLAHHHKFTIAGRILGYNILYRPIIGLV